MSLTVRRTLVQYSGEDNLNLGLGLTNLKKKLCSMQLQNFSFVSVTENYNNYIICKAATFNGIIFLKLLNIFFYNDTKVSYERRM